MSLIVKGAEMPVDCVECFGSSGSYCEVVGADVDICFSLGDRGRPAWCPLVDLSDAVRTVFGGALSDEEMTACNFEI